MKNISLKNYIPYLAAIVIFIGISMAYFVPDMFQNKTLYQHDVVTGLSVGQEVREFQERTGEKSLWTNSMFGGMPTYQTSPSYPSMGVIKEIQKISWLHLPAPASYVFILLIGAFLLFIALRVNPWLAIIGAIAYAFSSYFFIIIQAGHIWKVWVLAYIPPTFAGIIWAYRGKYWLGATVTAFYMALQLLSNHPQMTYYFGLLVLIFVIAEFIHDIKNKQLLKFFKASAVLLIAVGIAFAINLTNMYHTAEYSKYTIRGGSELTDGNEKDKTKGGLERSYATGWSYGIGETFTLLIPNTKGGSSSNYIGYKIVETPEGASLVKDPKKNKNRLNQISDPQIKEYIAQQTYYWGDQPGTSGPVYVGAFIVFLFVLGMFIVRGRFKWVLFAATVLSIMLSWGSNFMWFTNLFLDHFPYYNKMRAVSSILVIAELCIPILAILALKEVIDNPSVVKEKRKLFYISLACTAGLVLVFIMMPGVFFNFLSDKEVAGYGEMIKNSNPQLSSTYKLLVSELEGIRISIFRADAIRSFFIICLGALLTLLFSMKRINFKLFIVAIAALILFDMWQIDKRYLNSSNFKPEVASLKLVPKTPVDEEILKDTSLDYRVYNLTVSSFSDGTTSFYHKSIGGYHGAKLRRYQDVIERHISKINTQNVQNILNSSVLNMLNTKYIILPAQNGGQQLLQNPNALGNAWFINDIKWVNNANEEIAALTDINPAQLAVINKRYESDLKNFTPNLEEIAIENIDGDVNLSGNDANFHDNSIIELVEYNPNKLVYKSNTIGQKLAVFSEIYYPKGWYAYVDGKETPIYNVNYILRAVLVPEGEHTIEFRFGPQSYHTTESIAKIANIALLALVVFTIAWGFIRKRKEVSAPDVE